MACLSAKAPHAFYLREFITNFKIYERAYHASKFSGEMKNLNSVDFQDKCIKAYKFKRNFSAQKLSEHQILQIYSVARSK